MVDASITFLNGDSFKGVSTSPMCRFFKKKYLLSLSFNGFKVYSLQFGV
jgi:hypothetical protein